MSAHLRITARQVRRLAIAKQRLAGPRPDPAPGSILNTARDLGCLQLDPISAVERSHLLVMWSRVGPFDTAHMEHLLWNERSLFEYWAHAASIVLTEDYPIHNLMMREHAEGRSAWFQRMAQWAEDNRSLRDYILGRLESEGPLLSRQIEDQSVREWRSGGWTSGRNVARMLDHLWVRGAIMVAGRMGQQRKWDLTERCLPHWTPREQLEPRETVRLAAQRSLRALGVARPADIKLHYTRFRYPGLESVLKDLEAEGIISRVEVEEDGAVWPGPWYVHTEDIQLLKEVDKAWQPRTTLLSPFDNLICDRARTEKLWGFRFRIEIYVPKEKREYGYYVLSILHGDRLIGRIDPVMDRKRKRLTINAVHAEPGAPGDPDTTTGIRAAVEELGAFLGAKEIEFASPVPGAWSSIARAA